MPEATVVRKPIGLPDLPQDIFLLILGHLEAWDIVRGRKVCKSWRSAFSEPEYLQAMLKKYPLAREVHGLAGSGALNKPPETGDLDWGDIFNEVAARYFHLTHGKARSITSYTLAVPEHIRLAHWHAVSPWEYHESQPGGRLYHQSPLSLYDNQDGRPGERAYLFRPCFWSYEDGLLVYPPPKSAEYKWDPRSRVTVPVHYPLVLLDLATNIEHPIPFDLTKRVIRNFRLKDRTLIVEWAEETSFHALNDLERVHRHFASCYDIIHEQSSTQSGGNSHIWKISLRSEFKLHFLGLPLNGRDRFFSTHNSTHYAIYFFIPNRSMYTGDEELPIESFFVWDITQPSKYFSSLDPAGRNKPDSSTPGPKVVARFSFRELDHFGIRQHSAIRLMSFALDSAASTVTVRENICRPGQGYYDPAERLWCACATSFPFVGSGPHLRQEWKGDLPPYRGNGSMETVDVKEPEKWFLGIMDVIDDTSEVRFSLVETVFTGQLVENKKMVRIEALGRKPVALEDALALEVCHMGRVAGDERYLVGQNSNQEVVVLRF